jgi:hypothetical protein
MLSEHHSKPIVSESPGRAWATQLKSSQVILMTYNRGAPLRPHPSNLKMINLTQVSDNLLSRDMHFSSRWWTMMNRLNFKLLLLCCLSQWATGYLWWNQIHGLWLPQISETPQSVVSYQHVDRKRTAKWEGGAQNHWLLYLPVSSALHNWQNAIVFWCCIRQPQGPNIMTQF